MQNLKRTKWRGKGKHAALLNHDYFTSRLATKLLKLASDEKRELSIRKGLQGKKGGERADQLEEMVIELQGKIRELEKQKSNLAGRVTILRQQLDAKGKRHTQYDRVQPKVNSVSTTTAFTWLERSVLNVFMET